MIAIVIPVHNRVHLTLQCLTSLARQTYREFRILLIDDGSTDGTNEVVKRHFPELEVLHGDGNLWWTKATNFGISHVLQELGDGDYILTLNNDLVVPNDYLEKMISCAARHPQAILGSLSVDKKDKNRILWAGSTELPMLRQSILSGIWQVNELPGRGMLIPVSVFTEVGLFDDKDFPQYAADYDFSLRAKKQGYSLFLCCDTEVMSENFGGMQVNTWREFFRALADIHSRYCLRVKWKFIRRHKRYWPLQIIVDLLRTSGGTALYLSGLKKRQV